MLRFATWKIVSIIAMIVVAILLVVPSLLGVSTREALDARLPSWAHPKTLTLRPRSSGRFAHPAAGRRDRCRQDDGRQSARRCPSHPPRGEGRHHRRHRIAAARHRASCHGRGRSRQGDAETAAAHHFRCLDPRLLRCAGLRDQRQRHLDPDRCDGRRCDRQDPPGCRPVDRSHPPSCRRARHHRAADRARGHGPHSRRGAGPAGSREAEADPRHHSQARVPSRRAAGRGSWRCRGARPDRAARRQAAGREAGDGAG